MIHSLFISQESLDLLKFASEVTPQGEAALRAISKGLMVSFKYKALCHPSENRVSRRFGRELKSIYDLLNRSNVAFLIPVSDAGCLWTETCNKGRPLSESVDQRSITCDRTSRTNSNPGCVIAVKFSSEQDLNEFISIVEVSLRHKPSPISLSRC